MCQTISILDTILSRIGEFHRTHLVGPIVLSVFFFYLDKKKEDNVADNNEAFFMNFAQNAQLWRVYFFVKPKSFFTFTETLHINKASRKFFYIFEILWQTFHQKKFWTFGNFYLKTSRGEPFFLICLINLWRIFLIIGARDELFFGVSQPKEPAAKRLSENYTTLSLTP